MSHKRHKLFKWEQNIVLYNFQLRVQLIKYIYTYKLLFVAVESMSCVPESCLEKIVGCLWEKIYNNKI